MEQSRTRRWMGRPFRRGTRKKRLIPRWLMLLALLWAAGFALFARYASQFEGPTIPNGEVYDAALVLTGGAGRLQAAADMLKRNRVRHVFVSGVHRDVTASDLQVMLNLPETLATCCLFIDKRAKNTWQNAEEAMRWVTGMQARSVVLITADYHMPRSLYLFMSEAKERGAWPTEVLPYGVDTGASIANLFVEYHKYLLSLVLHFRWKG